MNMRRLSALVLLLGLFTACGGAAPEPASPPTASASSQSAAVTKPDRAKVVAHLREHVSYPVSRVDLLKACADTPEFTAGERKWFEAKLPDRAYKSADEAITAVEE